MPELTRECIPFNEVKDNIDAVVRQGPDQYKALNNLKNVNTAVWIGIGHAHGDQGEYNRLFEDAMCRLVDAFRQWQGLVTGKNNSPLKPEVRETLTGFSLITNRLMTAEKILATPIPIIIREISEILEQSLIPGLQKFTKFFEIKPLQKLSRDIKEFLDWCDRRRFEFSDDNQFIDTVRDWSIRQAIQAYFPKANGIAKELRYYNSDEYTNDTHDVFIEIFANPGLRSEQTNALALIQGISFHAELTDIEKEALLNLRFVANECKHILHGVKKNERLTQEQLTPILSATSNVCATFKDYDQNFDITLLILMQARLRELITCDPNKIPIGEYTYVLWGLKNCQEIIESVVKKVPLFSSFQEIGEFIYEREAQEQQLAQALEPRGTELTNGEPEQNAPYEDTFFLPQVRFESILANALSKMREYNSDNLTGIAQNVADSLYNQFKKDELTLMDIGQIFEQSNHGFFASEFEQRSLFGIQSHPEENQTFNLSSHQARLLSMVMDKFYQHLQVIIPSESPSEKPRTWASKKPLLTIQTPKIEVARPSAAPVMVAPAEETVGTLKENIEIEVTPPTTESPRIRRNRRNTESLRVLLLDKGFDEGEIESLFAHVPTIGKVLEVATITKLEETLNLLGQIFNETELLTLLEKAPNILELAAVGLITPQSVSLLRKMKRKILDGTITVTTREAKEFDWAPSLNGQHTKKPTVVVEELLPVDAGHEQMIHHLSDAADDAFRIHLIALPNNSGLYQAYSAFSLIGMTPAEIIKICNQVPAILYPGSSDSFGFEHFFLETFLPGMELIGISEEKELKDFILKFPQALHPDFRQRLDSSLEWLRGHSKLTSPDIQSVYTRCKSFTTMNAAELTKRAEVLQVLFKEAEVPFDIVSILKESPHLIRFVPADLKKARRAFTLIQTASKIAKSLKDELTQKHIDDIAWLNPVLFEETVNLLGDSIDSVAQVIKVAQQLTTDFRQRYKHLGTQSSLIIRALQQQGLSNQSIKEKIYEIYEEKTDQEL